MSVNGSLTYESSGGGSMKLRNMMNPEGVVVKTATGYAYRYFMRDYLNSVRHVSGIEQLTDYDPLGSIISSVNLDKNSYLYESKERYADFSDAYDGVYDFGARLYNPLYGRWFTPDPAKQGINPYIYCGNNPVMLVDPDGKKFRWPWIFQFWLRVIHDIEDEILYKSEEYKELIDILKINPKNYTPEEREKAQKKYDEYSELLKLLKQDEENLKRMNDDKEHVYLLRRIGPSQPANIYKDSKGRINVEFSSDGVFAHERVHVVQWLDDKNGEIYFNDNNILVYGNSNNENNYEYEVIAYKMQYVYNRDEFTLPKYDGGTIKASNINDITSNFVKQIGDGNGNRLYP